MGTDFVTKSQSVIVPLLSKQQTHKYDSTIKSVCVEIPPECDLRAEFHLNIVDLINAPQHQIDLDVRWSVGGVH